MQGGEVEMTVGELISILQTIPPDAQIYMQDIYGQPVITPVENVVKNYITETDYADESYIIV